MFLTAGQRSDDLGARALLYSLKDARNMLADREYHADRYREALEENGITASTPSRRGRKIPIPHDADQTKKHDKAENSFDRLKDWGRSA